MTTRFERTTAVLRKRELKYWKVEYWNVWAKVNVDLFNIIDLLVLDNGIVGIQVCGSDYASHVRKICEGEARNTRAWLEAGGRLEIWAWRRLKKKRGGKAMYWAPRIADVLLVDGRPYVEERKP